VSAISGTTRDMKTYYVVTERKSFGRTSSIAAALWVINHFEYFFNRIFYVYCKIGIHILAYSIVHFKNNLCAPVSYYTVHG